MSQRSWLRRNTIALVAAPFVVAAAFVVVDDHGLRDLWRNERRSIASAAPGAPAVWHDVRYELVTLEPVAEADFQTFWYTSPGTQVFHAHIDATPMADSLGELNQCKPWLIDSSGRRYAASPYDLDHSGLGDGCYPPLDYPTAPFDVDVYFLLPSGAVPRALRLGEVDVDDAVDLLVAPSG